jgi:hypothetical protein
MYLIFEPGSQFEAQADPELTNLLSLPSGMLELQVCAARPSFVLVLLLFLEKAKIYQAAMQWSIAYHNRVDSRVFLFVYFVLICVPLLFILQSILLAYISCAGGIHYDISEYAHIVRWLGFPTRYLSSLSFSPQCTWFFTFQSNSFLLFVQTNLNPALASLNTQLFASQ